MYFRRVKKLDLPDQFRQKILQEIDSGLITPTGMNERKNLKPLNEIVEFLKNRGDDANFINYITDIYGTTNLTGWELSPQLTKEIYEYYDSFLKLIPDEPKIIIKRIFSNTDKFNIHSDKKQWSSLTCVIRGAGPTTGWYEPYEKHRHKYRNPDGDRPLNKPGIIPYPADCYGVTSIQMDFWEMILFDHNAMHQVDQIMPGTDRILFSIGFLNTTEPELEDIYDKWSSTI